MKESAIRTVRELKMFLRTLPDDQELDVTVDVTEKQPPATFTVEMEDTPSITDLLSKWANYMCQEVHDVEPGIYRHYKGTLYEIMGVATHTETGEPTFVYRDLYGDKIWNRPLSMFSDSVEHEGEVVPRFVKANP